MTFDLTTLAVGFPLGAIIGWMLNKLLGPVADDLGLWVRDSLRGWKNSEYENFQAYSELKTVLEHNHKARGHDRFNSSKTYLYDPEIKKVMLKYSRWKKRAIAQAWIKHDVIGSYAAADLFFAGMELLLPSLTKDEIQSIYTKYKDSTQATPWPFFEQVETQRPELFTGEVLQYLRKEQAKWAEKTDQAMHNKGIYKKI